MIFSKRVLAFVLVAVIAACGVALGEPIKPAVSAQTCDAGACGPLPEQTNFTCSNGTLAGPTGRCILNQDGTCGWEIIACPAPDDAGCDDASVCGPRPLIADQICDGGATSGERCSPTNGSCGWVYVPCP